MSVTEFIRDNVSLFSGVPDDELTELSKNIDQQSYHGGQTVLFKGCTVDGLHIVMTGKVDVFVKTGHAAPAVKVAELGPGEVFGETSIIEMGTADATIKSSQDGTTVAIVPQSTFREVVSRNAELHARTRALIEARRPKSSK
jgi:CRP-like cAMP-binding protein